MQKNRISYGRSYKEIRPHVKKQIQDKEYDLIIDLHRDHLRADRTTTTSIMEKNMQKLHLSSEWNIRIMNRIERKRNC